MGTNSEGTISNCYSTCAVDFFGWGFAGLNEATISESFWDTETSGHSEGVGTGSSSGVMGRTTAQKQMRATFTDAGWDLVCETANGAEDIWTIKEGIKYPEHVRPLVQYYDWDGVDFKDYSFFSSHWMMIDCNDVNDCNSTDLNFSGTIDINDFGIFCSYWLAGTEPEL